MRFPIATSFLVSLLVAFTESASLRRAKGGWELTVDISEARDLQQADPAFDNSGENPYENDGSDAGIINEIITMFLPYFNNAFQAIVPDPLDLPFVGTFELPEVDIFACKANAAFDLDLGEIIGLSQMSIDRLQIKSGTEDVEAGCLKTLFNAVFDMTISSASLFAVRGLEGGFTARACGVSLRDSVTGGVDTVKPILSGPVSIRGMLEGTLATILFADTEQKLQVGYESVTGYLNEVPPAWNVVIGNATEQVGEAMKSELELTVEPEVNPKVKPSMEGQSVTMSYAQAMRYRTGFARNGVRRRIANFYEGTTNFFGNAFGFLGFSEGED